MSSNINTENWMKDIGVLDHLSGVGEGSTSAATKNITALVVDDDSVNQMIHSKILENLGIQNQVVRNGKEAVDLHSSGNNFDLILMDMDMPVMNGIEATRKLRAMGVRSIIAGVSTCTRDELEQKEFMAAGLDDFQEKPLTTPKLVSILQKVNKKC
ncbi:two-component response regulator 24-like [Juglans microcarpa x Juglans regia]|uniref:two-component response regulator 24-like n=1 Tax=Juglans microcarpa x Juglans regia TaxID=2249226 RepID=UPI001B7F53DA|nr:two-component response regulator 24-like [Juglans microcarpa x Juglans regia]